MTKFETILDDFAFLDDWDDRYKYLIDLGRNLTPYPEERRDDAHKVKGCASQVWLASERRLEGGIEYIDFYGDSDAHIVRGLVAVVLALYSGKSTQDITKINPDDALKTLDLNDHLTPQRSNGLASMIVTIRKIAAS